MINTRNLLRLLPALALLLFMPSAYCEGVLELGCVPEQGTVISPGEPVSYTLTVLEDVEGWVTLTVSLGDGMVMDEFNFYGAEELAEDEEYVPREIIPGNDGCVILASCLQAGDFAVFTAHAADYDAAARAAAMTGEHSVSIEHTVIDPPRTPDANTPAPVFLPADEPEVPEKQRPNTPLFIAIVLMITGAAGGICYASRRQWWMRRILNRRQSCKKK